MEHWTGATLPGWLCWATRERVGAATIVGETLPSRAAFKHPPRRGGGAGSALVLYRSEIDSRPDEARW